MTFKPGDLCYFYRHQGIQGWSPGMATVVSQVGQGHYYIDYGGRVFKQAAEQLRHISERERLALEAVREVEEGNGAQAAEPAGAAAPAIPDNDDDEPMPGGAFPDNDVDEQMPEGAGGIQPEAAGSEAPGEEEEAELDEASDETDEGSDANSGAAPSRAAPAGSGAASSSTSPAGPGAGPSVAAPAGRAASSAAAAARPARRVGRMRIRGKRPAPEYPAPAGGEPRAV